MTSNVISLSEERKKRGLEVPKEVPVLDQDFDIEDVPVMDRGFLWGPEYVNSYERQRQLNRYFAEQQGDPGDEG